MNLALDHLIITVSNLEAAMTTYRENGFLVHYGGQHVGGGTHNALVVFADGTYLELLAKTRPDAPTPYEAWFASGDGCAGFALGVDDIQACYDALQQQGYSVQPIREGGRTRADGVPIQWRVMPLSDASFPFLIEDITPRNLRVPFDDSDWINHANGSRGIPSVTANFSPGQLVILQALVASSGHEVRYQNENIAFQLGATHFLLGKSEDTQNVNFTISHA